MKSSIRCLLALVAVSLCAAPATHAAPASKPPPSPRFHGPPHVVYVSDAYYGRTITLSYGELLAVLVSSSSTPADWSLIADPRTPLRPVEDTKYTPPTQKYPVAPGSSHTVRYLFTVAKPAPVKRTCFLRFNLQDRGAHPRYVLERWRITVVIPRIKGVTTR